MFGVRGLCISHCIKYNTHTCTRNKLLIASGRYKCFLDSKEEEKGSDCLESFRGMQQCFSENPEHYKVPGERAGEKRESEREERT